MDFIHKLNKKEVRYWLMRISNNNHTEELSDLKTVFDGQMTPDLKWTDFPSKWDVDDTDFLKIKIHPILPRRKR